MNVPDWYTEELDEVAADDFLSSIVDEAFHILNERPNLLLTDPYDSIVQLAQIIADESSQSSCAD